jgi:hypothetical protein
VSPRPGSGRAVTTRLPGPVEAVVDADLGIVLRLVRDAGRPDPQVTELARLDLDVVIDPARFAAPSGSRLGESLAEALGDGGPAGWAARAVSGVVAGGLGAWIRHSRSSDQPPTAGDGEEMMPPGDPAPEITADGEPAGPPVSDELLGRLHEGGAGHFTAAVHRWVDVGAMASQIPEGARRVGFGGVGLLADAVSEQSAARLVSAARFGGPGQYQIDHSYSPRRRPQTVACDGQQRWQVRDDGTATLGPAGPPPKEFADLADPSWLLRCCLSGGEPVTADGRPGYRLSVARGSEGWLSMRFPAAVAVIDAELGIIRRLTYYIGGKPVRRSELRDITASDEEFRIDLPPGLVVTEETSRFGDSRSGPPAPVNIPLAIATAIGRQAATQAGNAARNLLNRLQGHHPQDGE